MSGRLRFEVWTLPSTGTFEYKATIPVAEGAAGTVALSEYSNVSINMTAADWEQYGPLILDEDNNVYSLIRVFDGSTVIDEFIAERVEIPKGRPQMRTISGPQLMGEVEKCGVYHPNYPLAPKSEETLDWIWGGENAINRYDLADLGSIREAWELWFEAGTEGSFTIIVDTEETGAFDPTTVDAGELEGSILSGFGLQGLDGVNDVTSSGEGTEDDPIVITFYDPPDPTDVTVDDTNITAGAVHFDKTTEGGLDPSPFTISKSVDAKAGDEEGVHGTYDPSAIVPVVGASFQDTDTDWVMLVNALTRYAGVQIRVPVVPGETYSNIAVRLKPIDFTGKYTLVIRDRYQGLIAQRRDVQLTAGVYDTITIPGTVTMPTWVDEVIFRVAVTDENPANIGDFVVNFQTGATMLRGRGKATPSAIVRTLFKHAQERGAFEWLDVDEKLSDTHDSNNVAFPSQISFTAYFRSNMGHVLENLRRMGDDTDGSYGWRITPKAAPVGQKTHDFEMFVPGPPVDHTASQGGPVILTGAHTPEATVVARIPTFTDMLGHGTGAVYSESADLAARAAVGRRERMVDVQHLATKDSIDELIAATFTEERRNRKALDAVVLGSDQDVPFVRYRPGDKVWWQFPGYHNKEAKPVARVSWIHGRVAQYRVQGSRRLSGEAALSQAVDRLLRQFKPRARPARRELPPEVGGGGIPDVVVAAADTKFKSDADLVAPGSADNTTILEAINRLPDTGGWIHLLEGTYTISDLTAFASGMHAKITGAGIGATRVVVADGATVDAVFQIGVGGSAVFEDLTVDGNDPSATVTHGLIIGTNTAGTDVYLNRVELTGSSSCGLGRQGSNGRTQNTWHLDGAYIHDNGDAGAALHEANSFWANSRVEGNGGPGIQSQNGLAHLLSGCRVAGNTGDGIDGSGLTGNSIFVVVGCRIASNGGDGVAVAPDVAPPSVIVGNLIDNNAGQSVRVPLDSVVHSNVLVDNGVDTPSPDQGNMVDGGFSGVDENAIHDNVAGEIQAIPEKVPVEADVLLIEDSADSYSKKRIQIANLPTGGGGSEAFRGAGQIDDPATSAVITHNLGVIPAPGEIQVQPRNVTHAVERFSVSAESSSQFTVTVDPAPGASQSFEFAWLYIPATIPTPPDVPTAGLILWLDSEDLVLSDNDPVATWPDRSGAGNDAAQGVGGNQPIYKTGIVNGLPVVRFGGIASEHYLTLPDLYAGATEGEIFVVLAVDADPPAAQGDTGLWRFGTHANATHYPYTDGVVYENWGSNSRKTTGNPSVDLTAFHSYNVSSAAADWSNRFNGVTFFNTTSNGVAFVTAPTLGRSSNLYYLDGDVACVLAYNQVLSSSDRAEVEAFLASRYGL